MEKLFRVKTLNNIITVKATSMSDAITKVRRYQGLLPNDINKKIVKNFSNNLNDEFKNVSKLLDAMNENSNELSWNNVYSDIDKINNVLKDLIQLNYELKESLLKVDKESKNENI